MLSVDFEFFSEDWQVDVQNVQVARGTAAVLQQPCDVFEVLLDLKRDSMSCSTGSWMADRLDEPVNGIRLDLGEDVDGVDAVVINEVVGDGLCHTDAYEECLEGCWFGHVVLLGTFVRSLW